MLKNTGRLIVDLELTASEAQAVRLALHEMAGLKYDACLHFHTSTATAPTIHDRFLISPRSRTPVQIDDPEFARIFHSPIEFEENPQIDYGSEEAIPEVLATTQITALAFNQGKIQVFILIVIRITVFNECKGVNAWQTLANISFTTAVLQTEVNLASLSRLRSFICYIIYLSSL
jgi:hypothetical protein